MNLLLDTHILLWHLEGNPKLSTETSALIENTAHQKFLVLSVCGKSK
jgi:PIN domain nuclease of toxin-antitoxin system